MVNVRMLLATDRLAVYALFSHIQEIDPQHFTITHIPMAEEVLAKCLEYLPAAAVFVIDVAPDPVQSIQLCQAVHSSRSDLPMMGLICCPRCVSAWHLRSLAAAGVGTIVDFYSAAEDLARVLRQVADGDSIVRLQLHAMQGSFLGEILGEPEGEHRLPALTALSENEIRVLALVSQGVTDREIGSNLHLSEHTIRHNVERLREKTGTRNRTALAAWAAHQGFYRQHHFPPWTEVEAGLSAKLRASR